MAVVVTCTFFAFLIAFLCVYCKNATINININYPEPKFIELEDTFNKEGEPVEKETQATIDDILKTVNSIMLDREENIDE